MTYGDNFRLCNLGHAWVGVAKHTVHPRNPAFLPLLPPCLPLLASLASVSLQGMGQGKHNLVLPALTSSCLVISSFIQSLYSNYHLTFSPPNLLQSPCVVSPCSHASHSPERPCSVYGLVCRRPDWHCSLLYLETECVWYFDLFWN